MISLYTVQQCSRGVGRRRQTGALRGMRMVEEIVSLFIDDIIVNAENHRESVINSDYKRIQCSVSRI